MNPRLILTISIILASFQSTLQSRDNDDDIFRDISSKYGIEVRYKIDSRFFPNSWKRSPIKGRAVPIVQKELPRFAAILDAALRKYPVDLVRYNLKGVYIASEMIFYNTAFGGTNTRDVIYLTSRGEKMGYTDAYITGTIHHEFSSILLRNYSFPEDEWKACNPYDFRYGKGGRIAIRDGRASRSGSVKLYTEGFLSQYSRSAFEEDFNVMSEMALSRPGHLKKIVEKYPVIKKKFNIWLRFYKSLDPQFTFNYIFNNDESVSR